MASKLAITKERPSFGQFIGIWIHKDQLWSTLFKWEIRGLFYYTHNSEGDVIWYRVSNKFTKLDITYLTLPNSKK